MAESEDNASLPIAEDVLRKSIIRQIDEFGIDKLTSRLIRENLKKEFHADFGPFKTQIDKVAMQQVQEHNRAKEEPNKSSESNESESDGGGVVFTDSAPKKKTKVNRKRATSESDSDLLEVGQKRRRAAPKKAAPKRKKPEGGVKRKTAYSVCCALTDELASIVGKQYMRRSDVVKTMWAYFRSNSLLDPSDKRYVLTDEPLTKLFKKRRFLAFGMMKDLAPHIIEAKHLDETERAALEAYEKVDDARRAAEEEAKRQAELKQETNNSDEKDSDAESSNKQETNGKHAKLVVKSENDETDSD